MTPEEYTGLSAATISRRVSTGELSVREVIEACLAVIDRENPGLNALTVIRREEALREAEALDAAIALALLGRSAPGGSGTPAPRAAQNADVPGVAQTSSDSVLAAPLLGVPIAVKEEYDVAGLPTTLGGWGNTTPAACDSEAIRRVRAAGAIIVAKTTMPEFGIFTDTVCERYGATRNPHHTDYSPGGSSGGSAAAVASGMVPIALGADGGGSIRIPASCCGIIGLKPARGRISSAPLTHHWHSLVTLGALTRSVEDMAVVNDVLSGSLPTDRFAAPPLVRPHEAALATPCPRLTIAWTDRSALRSVRTHPAIRDALGRTVKDLEGLGHQLRRTGRVWPAATIPFATQFTAGVTEEAQQVEHPQALEKRTRQVAMIGRAVSRGRVEAAIVQSVRIGRLIDQRFLGAADVVLLPTVPVPVGRSGMLMHRPILPALKATSPTVANTAVFNVSGHPAISVPARVDEGCMPIGMQLVTRPGNEHLLISLAFELEKLYGEVKSVHPRAR